MWWMSVALAKSWCADPLLAHEWGVTVLSGDAVRPARPELPAHFHRPGAPFGVKRTAVRTLPADSGIRTLPVVHFYDLGYFPDPPLAVEVGFTEGEASVWYPAVDARTSAEVANGDEAQKQSVALATARDGLEPMGERPDLGRDPAKQLHWDALQLSVEPKGRPVPTDVDWVDSARALDGALWVNGGPESERFLFYEADTVESPALTVKGWTVHNHSEHPVHDVFIGESGRFGFVEQVPPGGTASLAEVSEDALEKRLRQRWSAPLKAKSDECVMMRDPMKPVVAASDHRMTSEELDLLWSVWKDRFFDDAPHLVYREDTAQLDRVMPVSLFTDMRHHIEWSRLGIVLVERPEGL